MELLLEFILEIFGEVFLGAAVSVFDDRLPDEMGTRLSRLFGYLVLGTLFGFLSTLVFPTPTLSTRSLRVAWLFAAPLVGGLSMSLVKALRSDHPGWLRPWAMAYGAALVGAVNLCRFLVLG